MIVGHSLFTPIHIQVNQQRKKDSNSVFIKVQKGQVRTAGWLTVNDGQSLLNAAISGLGIAYLPSFLYADAMEQGIVQEAIPDLPVETQGIYAVYPPGRFTQPKVRAFIDFLVHAFAEKGPDNW